MRDVAREANVSLATVSYVLNRSSQADRIRPETQSRVLAAVQRLRYRIDPIGRALQQGQTRQVILLIVSWDLALSHSATAMAISRAAFAQGYELTVHVADDDALATDFLTRRAMHHLGGLLVLWDSPALHQSPVVELAAEGIPVVDLLPGSPDGICTVTADREDAFFQGTQHLIDLGHRRIGMIGDSLKRSKTTRLKLAGYRRALAKAGLPSVAERVQDVLQFGFEGGRTGGRSLLEHLPDLTAILCINDAMALGVLAAATEAGLECPQDLSIVGFGDADEGRYFRPRLTTIGLSSQRVADAAIGLLTQIQRGETRQTHTVLVREDLIVRESTGPVPPGQKSEMPLRARPMSAPANR